MWVVEIAKSADRELKKAPREIRDAFDAWRNLVEQCGPAGLQRINGYWDHGLSGDWNGARSSSLNQKWRVIYVANGNKVHILVLKVTPHDYRRK